MLMELKSNIDRLLNTKQRILIAIEGKSASGKSTLAGTLSQHYDCNVYHMDDFFLRPEQRTPERLLEVGGNVDYERFKTDILDNIEKDMGFSYRPYCCRTGELGECITIVPKNLSIIEGVYSMHLALRASYDWSIFLTISEEAQTSRILKRSGEELLKRYKNEWIPLENNYFATWNIRETCNIVL